MIKVYFENKYGVAKEIGVANNEKEAFQVISNFCYGYGFKIHYVREWVEDNKHWYDVGSHSEFFYTMEE